MHAEILLNQVVSNRVKIDPVTPGSVFLELLPCVKDIFSSKTPYSIVVYVLSLEEGLRLT